MDKLYRRVAETWLPGPSQDKIISTEHLHSVWPGASSTVHWLMQLIRFPFYICVEFKSSSLQVDYQSGDSVCMKSYFNYYIVLLKKDSGWSNYKDKQETTFIDQIIWRLTFSPANFTPHPSILLEHVLRHKNSKWLWEKY